MENELLRQELNPFMPGAGMQPPELVGRERDLEIVDRMIARTKLNNLDRGIIFSGLRGVGKTVLLVKLQEMAAGKNMLTTKIESSGNPDDDYEAIFHEINLAAMKIHLVGGLKKRLGDVISNIKSMSFGAFGLSASISRESSAQTSENPFKLELLIESITTELKKSNSGQEMADEPLGTLMSIQHKMGQRSLPFYIIGAGLPNLPGVLSKSRSYAERLFEYRTIGQLSDADAAEGFQKPARRNGRPFTDDALNELIKVSSGYPYFIQAYGKAAWNASGSNPIPLQAVTKSEACARAELDDGLYSARWQRTTPTGRRYLAAMAKIGTESPSSTAEVADRLGKSTGEISMTRDKLIKLGLIYSPEYGKVAFTVPGMGEFILRAMPSDGQVYDGR